MEVHHSNHIAHKKKYDFKNRIIRYSCRQCSFLQFLRVSGSPRYRFFVKPCFYINKSGQCVNYISFLEKSITIMTCHSFIFIWCFERIYQAGFITACKNNFSWDGFGFKALLQGLFVSEIDLRSLRGFQMISTNKNGLIVIVIAAGQDPGRT